jgi:hypothetical protein
MIGYEVGRVATAASHSVFMGFKAGWAAVSASYNTLIGYNVGNYTASAFGLISGSFISGSAGAWGNPSSTANRLGYNNIIIGNNITVSGSTNNAVNIGAVLFISGTYFDPSTTGNPFTGSAGGKMGINVPNPLYNFHVSGTVGFTNLVTSSTAVTNVLMVSSSGQLFITASSAVGTTTPAGVKAGSGSVASFGGSPLTSSITFTTAFGNNLYAVSVIGEDARSWTIQSKVSGSFVINSNSIVPLTGPIYWIATPFSNI